MNIKKYFTFGATLGLFIAAYFIWQKLHTVTPDTILSGNGRIEATEVNIASKSAGQLIEVLVKEGELVEAGQILARIKVSALEARIKEAEAQQKQAEDAVNMAEAQVDMRISEKEVAKAVVDQRLTELTAAQRRVERLEALAEDGAVSIQQLDNERVGVKSAFAVLGSAKSQVRSADSAILAARSQVSSAKSQVEAAKATVERLNYDMEDAQLKAPLNARVQFQIAQPGEMVAAGGRVMNLIDLFDVYMTFFLPEKIVGRIAIGSEVRIILDTDKNTVIPARISFIADTAQFTPKSVETENERQRLMFRVKANIDPQHLENGIGNVKTGLPGVAYIKIDQQAEWPIFLNDQVVL